MKIVTDSASLYSPQEGLELGFTVIPACVIHNEQSYKDFEDITSEDFLDIVSRGDIPTSSQPSIGDVLEVLEASDEEILYLSIGDGLSGAYQNAMGAKNTLDSSEHVHIVDTKTLAGPERYLVQKALQLRDAGFHIAKIKAELQKCIATSASFVIPADFDFLKRSGRLTPIAAKIGGLIKIVPVLTQTEDMRRITPFAIKRSWRTAVDSIIKHFHALGINENYIISISHAGAQEKAKEILHQIKEHFHNATFELFQLSPTLITHGGPGCVVIQVIMK